MFGSAKQQHGHSRSKTPNGAPRVGDEGDDSDIGEFNDSDVEGLVAAEAVPAVQAINRRCKRRRREVLQA